VLKSSPISNRQNVRHHFKTTTNLKELALTFLTVLMSLTGFTQTASDSIYKAWWTKKNNSIFQSVHSGEFSGIATGYIQLVNNQDTLLLDFQTTKAILKMIPIGDSVYDDNSKKYSTQTTSSKTTLEYETFMLANVMTIILNGVNYGIGVFDGASDMPVPGLTFNYCHESNTEYLTLFVTKPLRLTTSAYLFNKGNISYHDASKNEKAITVLSGSTIIWTVKK
jgi:hypothetical protein